MNLVEIYINYESSAESETVSDKNDMMDIVALTENERVNVKE